MKALDYLEPVNNVSLADVIKLKRAEKHRRYVEYYVQWSQKVLTRIGNPYFLSEAIFLYQAGNFIFIVSNFNIILSYDKMIQNFIYLDLINQSVYAIINTMPCQYFFFFSHRILSERIGQTIKLALFMLNVIE